MGLDSGLYKLLLVLHLVTVVVGFGTVTLNGLYAARAKKRGGPEAGAIHEANFFVSNVAEKVIYLVPIFGLGLVGVSDGAWDLGQTWIWLSLVLYAIGIGISHGVLIPGERKLLAIGAAGPPGPEAEAIEKRVAGAGMTLNLLLVVLIVLMVWKPGV